MNFATALGWIFWAASIVALGWVMRREARSVHRPRFSSRCDRAAVLVAVWMASMFCVETFMDGNNHLILLITLVGGMGVSVVLFFTSWLSGFFERAGDAKALRLSGVPTLAHRIKVWRVAALTFSAGLFAAIVINAAATIGPFAQAAGTIDSSGQFISTPVTQALMFSSVMLTIAVTVIAGLIQHARIRIEWTRYAQLCEGLHMMPGNEFRPARRLRAETSTPSYTAYAMDD